MSSSTDPLDSAIPVGPGASTPPPTPPPVSAHAPRTVPSGSDKIWAILSHVSSMIGVPFILPLIVYLAMRDDSAYVASNAKEALNFHISLFIYGLCLLPLMFIFLGIPLAVIMAIAAFILAIVAAVKAADGEVYRYPLTIRLIK